MSSSVPKSAHVVVDGVLGKRCSRCCTHVTLSEFVRDAGQSDGLGHRCRACSREMAAKLRAENTEKNEVNRGKARRWAEENREYLRAKARERTSRPEVKAARKAKDQEAKRNRPPRYEHAQSLKRKYGLTLDDYDRMLAEQGGCKICRSRDSGRLAKDGVTPAVFAVDHDHKTGRVRGLLCTQCNVMIGMAKESPERCIAAAKYLLDHGANYESVGKEDLHE